MPLPSTGPISFADLNIEIGNASNAQLDLQSASIALQKPGAPYGMDELYSQSLPPTYSIVGSPDSQDEGLDVDFVVTTTNVPNGTTLYWTIAPEPGDTQPIAADFVGGSLTGTVVVSGGVGLFSITINLDQLTEGEEVFVMQLREGSHSGTFLTQSQSIFINDTSTTPPPPPPTSLYYLMVACDGGLNCEYYGLSSPSTNVYYDDAKGGRYFAWDQQSGYATSTGLTDRTASLQLTGFPNCGAVQGE